ncbi:MAG: hypothetical protein M9939_04915 [Mesorhizobium sp.]|nr:hypothetical protein [Mesorhizobium sp.]MCO5160453.1 hypothetical protein [Mesorhizobium sp.]
MVAGNALVADLVGDGSAPITRPRSESTRSLRTRAQEAGFASVTRSPTVTACFYFAEKKISALNPTDPKKGCADLEESLSDFLKYVL